MKNISHNLSSKYSFAIQEKYPRINIIHHRQSDGTLWATRGKTVLVKQSEDWNEYAQFPICLPRDLFGFSRPTARAMRTDQSNIYVNSRGHVLGIRGGKVFAIESGHPPRYLFSIQGDCALRRSICEDLEGWIYFGEYFMNSDKNPVRIWRVSPDLSQWEIAYQFMAGSIRHVHGIYNDPFTPGTFWITTGDYEDECYIYEIKDRFRTIEKYGDGSQHWRAVNLLFTDAHVNWLTDSNLQQNHACRMKRSTGELELGQNIDCSSWYGCTTIEGLHISFTTVERGPAILSDQGSILVSEDAFQWQKIFSFKKDFYRPVQLFKYGVLSCPSGEISMDEMYLSGEGLVGLDGSSMKVKISRVGD